MHYCVLQQLLSPHCNVSSLCSFETADLKEVVVGLHRKSQANSQYASIIGVARLIPSPRYGSPNQRSNDIMLIELSHPAIFNDAVSPICLPAATQTIVSNTRCYASGWGALRWRKCFECCGILCCDEKLKKSAGGILLLILQ
jgi:Trypsin